MYTSTVRRAPRAAAQVLAAVIALAAFLVLWQPSPADAASGCTRSWAAAVDGSWTDGANWTPAGTPTASDDVCIDVSGPSFTVTLNGSSTVNSLQVGGSPGADRLRIEGTCSVNSVITANNDSKVFGSGRIFLSSTGCGTSATLRAPSDVPVLTNEGTIVSEVGAGGARVLRFDTTNTGTLDIEQSLDAQSPFTLVNQGTITIDDGKVLDWANGDATNGAGGSIDAAGTGALVMNGGTFHQGMGTTSGTAPVVLTATSIDYTGTGSSTVLVRSTSGELTGDIAAGQTLIVQSDCFVNTSRSLPADVTNDGTIILRSSGCGTSNTLSSATARLTNNGTIDIDPGAGGARNLSLDITNFGTIEVSQNTDSVGNYDFRNRGVLNLDSASLNWRAGDFLNGGGASINGVGGAVLAMTGGTYEQGPGTTTGTLPVFLTSTDVVYSGSGSSTVLYRGTSSAELSGDISAGQTLLLRSDCSFHSSIEATGSFTNDGDIILTSTGCGTNATLGSPDDTVVLTNNGTITAEPGTGGNRNLSISITNDGDVDILTNTDAVFDRNFVNSSGDVNIGDGLILNWRGGPFDLAGGAINGGVGGRLTGSGLFTQGDGRTTGNNPIVRSGSVDFTGTGKSKIKAIGTSGMFSGTIHADQIVTIEASCSAHATRTIDADFTNNGKLKLLATGCPNIATLTAATDVPVLTNNGTLVSVEGAGGTRNLAVSVVNNGIFKVKHSVDATTARTFVNNGTVNISNDEVLNWRSGDFTHGTGAVIKGNSRGSVVMSGGTFHMGRGNTRGLNPVIVSGTNIDFNAAGPALLSRIVARGTGGTLTGGLVANQELEIQATCSAHASRATVDPVFVNKGTVILSADTCGNIATLDATGRTFENNGTFIVDDTIGGTRNVFGTFVNKRDVVLGLVPLTHTGPDFITNLVNSNIEVRVASSGAGRINSSGAFTLGTTLTIDTDGGFWPTAGQTILVFNGSAPRTGTFATVNGTTRGGEAVTYSVQYLADDVNLTTA